LNVDLVTRIADNSQYEWHLATILNPNLEACACLNFEKDNMDWLPIPIASSDFRRLGISGEQLQKFIPVLCQQISIRNGKGNTRAI
jgi:hypothetical protein